MEQREKRAVASAMSFYAPSALHVLFALAALELMLVPRSVLARPITPVGLGVGCQMLNNCNGHGTCNPVSKTCNCYHGWGSTADVSYYKSPDCSLRVCPAGKAWADMPLGAAAHAMAECSNGGLCDRARGVCDCFEGYEGRACNRRSCPNSCSGHGICMNMRQVARMSSGTPLSPPTLYEGYQQSSTWDQEGSYGCVCDSAWEVGLGPGQVQDSEYFGPDCSLRRCPTGDDPMTDENELDCSGKTAMGGHGIGLSGNICHVDCSNRGICDFKTGICKCFSGFYGANCGTQNPFEPSTGTEA